MLGVITEDGDRFFSRFEAYVTAEYAKHVVLALCGEFQKDVIVVLDGAPCVRPSAVTDLAARNDLGFVRLPVYSPELNPAEECWRQVKTEPGDWFFGPLEEITTVIDDTLDQLSVPNVENYF